MKTCKTRCPYIFHKKQRCGGNSTQTTIPTPTPTLPCCKNSENVGFIEIHPPPPPPSPLLFQFCLSSSLFFFFFFAPSLHPARSTISFQKPPFKSPTVWTRTSNKPSPSIHPILGIQCKNTALISNLFRATLGVMASASAFLASHQCYCAGSSPARGLNLRALVCGIF